MRVKYQGGKNPFGLSTLDVVKRSTPRPLIANAFTDKRRRRLASFVELAFTDTYQIVNSGQCLPCVRTVRSICPVTAMKSALDCMLLN